MRDHSIRGPDAHPLLPPRLLAFLRKHRTGIPSPDDERARMNDDRLHRLIAELQDKDRELARREEILRRALDGDDSGDFDALVTVVRAVDTARTRAEAEVERLREALIPFAFAARGSLERLGLADEHDEARRLLGLEDKD